jgi:hypothetical protein
MLFVFIVFFLRNRYQFWHFLSKGLIPLRGLLNDYSILGRHGNDGCFWDEALIVWRDEPWQRTEIEWRWLGWGMSMFEVYLRGRAVWLYLGWWKMVLAGHPVRNLQEFSSLWLALRRYVLECMKLPSLHRLLIAILVMVCLFITDIWIAVLIEGVKRVLW